MGLAIGAFAGLIPAWIGWIGLFFDLGFAGLLSMLIVPAVLLLVRVRREKGRPNEPTGLDQLRDWWATRQGRRSAI